MNLLGCQRSGSAADSESSIGGSREPALAWVSGCEPGIRLRRRERCEASPPISFEHLVVIMRGAIGPTFVIEQARVLQRESLRSCAGIRKPSHQRRKKVTFSLCEGIFWPIGDWSKQSGTAPAEQRFASFWYAFP